MKKSHLLLFWRELLSGVILPSLIISFNFDEKNARYLPFSSRIDQAKQKKYPSEKMPIAYHFFYKKISEGMFVGTPLVEQ